MSEDLRPVIDRLAREVFPTYERASLEPHRFPPGALPESSGLWTAIVQAILSVPSFKAAEAAVRGDPIIAQVIEAGQLIRSTATRSGKVLQTEVLPVGLIQAACMEHAVHGDALMPDSLAARAVANVDQLRAGLAGDEITVERLIFFSGVTLTPDQPVHTPWGDLIHANCPAAEIFLQPGAASPTAVLAVGIRARLVRDSPPEPFGTKAPSQAREIGQTVTYAIAVGSDPENPAGAMLGMTGSLLPFEMPGGGREIRTVGLPSRHEPLSEGEAREIARWIVDLDAVPLQRIEVALRRLVRALTERVDWADVIIDAVIAWENLVEHRDAPTASVLWGIRKLTEDTDWSRRRIQTVYETRSDIVHGDDPKSSDPRSDAQDAIRVGLDAMQRLLAAGRDDPAILEMSSEERALALGYSLSAGR